MARILIVDDSDANLKLMTYELEKAGFEVATARSGREAIARIHSRRPDCVLLDVLMPEMDGFETCRRLKAEPELASIPVLMWTSLDSTDDIVRGLEAGAQDYVTKPFVSEVLHARIRAVLRAKEDRDALIESNRRLDEAQRSAKQALNVRNEFLSHVSHELRTPLSTLHQFLSIVLDGLAGQINGEQHEYLEICLRNAKQLRSMIGDLMDVTRLQNGKLRVAPRPLDLGQLIHEVVRGQEAEAEAKDVALGCRVDALPEVLADELRVRQVLANLIDNAIKFTPEGGRIDVGASRDPESPDFVCISVRDTGCGVAEEARRRIFNYMQQEGDDDWRSRKGLGIGLYICRELVTRQRGRIWVESESGKGSSFCFTLPVFDFAKLIEPVLVRDGRLRESYALVRVDLSPSDPASSHGLPEAMTRRAYHVVKSNLYPGDVLLPRFFGVGPHDTYFAVAATDATGMQSLCARIRSALGAEKDLDPSRVAFAVRGLSSSVPADQRELPLGEGLAAVAERIEVQTRVDARWEGAVDAGSTRDRDAR